jgi:hypothetical protein
VSDDSAPEQTAPTYEDVKRWAEEDKNRRKANKSGGSWKDTEAEVPQYKHGKNAGNKISGLPVGWSTTGTVEKPKR